MLCASWHRSRSQIGWIPSRPPLPYSMTSWVGEPIFNFSELCALATLASSSFPSPPFPSPPFLSCHSIIPVPTIPDLAIPLLRGLDASPRAGADTLGRRRHFGGSPQPLFDL